MNLPNESPSLAFSTKPSTHLVTGRCWTRTLFFATVPRRTVHAHCLVAPPRPNVGMCPAPRVLQLHTQGDDLTNT